MISPTQGLHGLEHGVHARSKSVKGNAALAEFPAIAPLGRTKKGLPRLRRGSPFGLTVVKASSLCNAPRWDGRALAGRRRSILLGT